MKILILGFTGLLGQAVVAEAKNRGISYDVAGSETDDLLDPMKLESVFFNSQPNVVINCIAYTNVDQAEIEQKEALALNCEFVSQLITKAKHHNAKLVHISTDYVFNGLKKSAYRENNIANPSSVYGRTKLLGEVMIQQSGYNNWLILRTSWLFGPHKDNFLTKIKKKAEELDQLKIVNDQWGNPTYTLDLSQAIFDLIGKGSTGLFHYANQGSCTWYSFAKKFLSQFGLDYKIVPCASKEFKTLAPRPYNSKFDLSKVSKELKYCPPSWESAVEHFSKGIINQKPKSVYCAGVNELILPNSARYLSLQIKTETTTYQLTIYYFRVKDAWLGKIVEYPGFITQGNSLGEIIELLWKEFKDTAENYPDELESFR